ncbi:hypothetical protein GCM10009837_42220 [Streptomyces durmitorensis]
MVKILWFRSSLAYCLTAEGGSGARGGREPFLRRAGFVFPGMGQGEKGDGALVPAVPAALLDAYWLMVDSPARLRCERCRPEQEKGSPACALRRFCSSEEVDHRRHQGAVSRKWWMARAATLAFASGSVVVAVWATAVAGG